MWQHLRIAQAAADRGMGHLALALVLITFGCHVPTSDEPPPLRIRVVGEIRAADGTLQPRTAFSFWAYAPTCADQLQKHLTGTTDALGKFDTWFPAPGNRFDGCVEVHVVTGSGTSVTRLENVSVQAIPTDSIFIRVQLP